MKNDPIITNIMKYAQLNSRVPDSSALCNEKKIGRNYKSLTPDSPQLQTYEIQNIRPPFHCDALENR